ncbi:hypothetical protein D3C76_1291410 [compost metagenome]
MRYHQLTNPFIQTLHQKTFFDDGNSSRIHITTQGNTALYHFPLFKINGFYFFIRHTKKIRYLADSGLLYIDDPSVQNVIDSRSGQTNRTAQR